MLLWKSIIFFFKVTFNFKYLVNQWFFKNRLWSFIKSFWHCGAICGTMKRHNRDPWNCYDFFFNLNVFELVNYRNVITKENYLFKKSVDILWCLIHTMGIETFYLKLSRVWYFKGIFTLHVTSTLISLTECLYLC